MGLGVTARAEPIEVETPCPKAPLDDPGHCEHWYDDAAPCCRCCDDGGKVHGDHHPTLDCTVCAERINDGRVTFARSDELSLVRYERTGRSFP
jgi:hypothetical protein